MRDTKINGLPEFLTVELKAVGNEAEQEARKNGCASVEVLKNVYAEAIMIRVARDADEIIEGLRVELGRLSAPVAGEPSPTYFEPEPANQAKCKICGTFAAYHRIGRCPQSVNVAYSNSSEPKLPA